MLIISEIKFDGDYKSQLTDIIEAYRKEFEGYPINARIIAIDALISKYISDTDERPDGAALYRLADVLLYDYLEGDTRPNKVKTEEYPILSERQYKYRQTGYDRKKNAQGVVNYEVPFSNAGTIATDGRNHARPIRRYD